MKTPFLPGASVLLAGLATALSTASAHDLATGQEHAHYDWSVKPPEAVAPEWFLAQAQTNTPRPQALALSSPRQAAVFQLFAPRVQVRWDEKYLFVESNGLPAHPMMIGITNWQQQVPLPQSYTGANAWRIPLEPVPSKMPVSIKGKFLRGAIALAANGIPIFNPQNNRGEISAEIGELDQWGGHCGRADDYHYHAAPLHLQAVVGKGQPIAYAMDGYAIYGLTEPDGSAPTGLDAFNGHTTPGLGYHYHASTKYPYVNGGFHGEVVEVGGQVDPQPNAQPVRPAGAPLRGAKITGFETAGNRSKLTYEQNGQSHAILYTINADGTVPFEFQNGSAGTTQETYTHRERGGGGAGGEANPPPRNGEQRPPRPEAGPQRPAANAAASAPADSLFKPNAAFILKSPEVADGGNLPTDYTGDGRGATPPLAWTGAPAATRSYALIMEHQAPDGMKSYWVVWDIPTSVTSLPKNVQGVGKVGISFKRKLGYEPPHSQGPGPKTYVLTVYALSAPVQIAQQPREVTREVLLAAMKDQVLASASLHVVSTRAGTTPAEGARPPRREDGPKAPQANAAPPSATPAAATPAVIAEGPQPGGNKGGGRDSGLIKPRMDDTIKVNVYADNWFVMFINGELVAVDSIKFTPHNVMSLDILPQYPMTIAIMAKDNADPKTGLEYGDHIGDGGFIIKFGDGTVSNATWKAKNFFKGPLQRDIQNPQVEHTPIPDHWWSVEFDDRAWPQATEYPEERVNPKEPFYQADFAGAKFIWSEDLDLDNTVIFRTKIEKPDWHQRWNTHPDLDITGAPFQ